VSGKLRVFMKMAVFCDVVPYSLIETRRFRYAYCIHTQSTLMMEAVSTSETSGQFIPDTRRKFQKTIFARETRLNCLS
jgi:hypothetical protein